LNWVVSGNSSSESLPSALNDAKALLHAGASWKLRDQLQAAIDIALSAQLEGVAIA
jgi:hypothetical protein